MMMLQAFRRDWMRPHRLRPTIFDHQDGQSDCGLVRSAKEAIANRDSGVLFIAMRHVVMSAALATASNAKRGTSCGRGGGTRCAARSWRALGGWARASRVHPTLRRPLAAVLNPSPPRRGARAGGLPRGRRVPLPFKKALGCPQRPLQLTARAMVWLGPEQAVVWLACWVPG